MTGPAEHPPSGYATGGPIEPGSVMPSLGYGCGWLARPVADFWRDGQPVPAGRLTMPDWDDAEVTALLENFLAGRPLPAAGPALLISDEARERISAALLTEAELLFADASNAVEPKPAIEPVDWDDLVDFYGQVDPPQMPRAIVADERTWDALRRVAPVVPRQHVTSLGAPFAGSLGNLLSIPVVVHREPRRARHVRRTGPLVGRRAWHAGALRVARLQRRVDRRAARRVRQAAPAVYGMFW